MDGFATKPAQTRQYVFDDGPDNDKGLWGAYTVFPVPVLPEGNMDIYYIGLFRRQAQFDQGSARETRHSVGTRLWRTKKPLDYNFEFVFQWGALVVAISGLGQPLPIRDIPRPVCRLAPALV